MFSRPGEDEVRDGILDVLVASSDYRERLLGLLGRLRDAAGVRSAHLYVTGDAGDVLYLEQRTGAAAAVRAPPGPPRPALGVFGGRAGGDAPPPLADEGGRVDEAESAATPLELRRTPEHETAHVAPTPAGAYWSMPLRTTAGLEGLVLLGPVDGPPVKHARRALEATAPQAALALRMAREQQTLRVQLDEALARETVGRRLQGSALEPDRFVRLLLELAVRAARSEAGFVAIADAGGRIAIRVAAGLREGFAEAVDLHPEDGLFDWSFALDGGGLLLRDVDVTARLGVRSLLAVPLLRDGRPLGVFALLNYERAAELDEDAIRLLETYAEQITLMLDNARLFATFADSYLGTLKGLAASLDARRASTRGHHELVAQAAAAIGREAGMAPELVQALHTAGLVHDIGLAGVVERGHEFAANAEHPAVGASMVEHLPLDPAIAEAIAGHHEAHDGRGFPAGLAGADIPPAGRVLALAEFVAERRAGTAVRAPAGDADLIADLQLRRGRQFDPDVVDAAVRWLRESAVG